MNSKEVFLETKSKTCQRITWLIINLNLLPESKQLRKEILLLILISGFQVLCLSILSAVKSDSRTLEDSFETPIFFIAKIVCLYRFPDFSSVTGFEIFIVGVILSYLIFMSIYLGHILIQMCLSRDCFWNLGKHWIRITNFHNNLAYFPVNCLLINFLEHGLNTQDEISILYIILSIAFILINSLFFILGLRWNIALKTNNRLSRKHQYCYYVDLAQKTLVYMIIALPSSLTNSLSASTNILNLIFSMIQCSLYARGGQFFSQKLNKIMLAFHLFTFTTSSFNLIKNLIGSSILDDSSSLMFLMLISYALITKLVLGLQNAKLIQNLINIRTNSKTNQKVDYLNYIHLIRKAALKETNFSITSTRFDSDEIMNAYIIKILYLDNSQKYTPEDVNSKVQLEEKKMLFLEIIKKLVTHLKGIDEKLNVAFILANDYKLVYDSYSIISSLTKMSLSSSQLFSLFSIKMLNQRIMDSKIYSSDYQTDLNAYIYSNQIMNQSVTLINNQLDTQSKFYKKMLDENPDLYSIFRLSSATQSHQSEFTKFSVYLNQEIIDHHANLLLILGFYNHLNFRFVLGNQYLKKYYQILKRKITDGGKLFKKKNMLENDETVTILIGAEKHNFGEVLNASRNIDSIFGVLKSFVKGKKINELMPTCYRDIHDSFMMDKIKDPKKTFRIKTIETFALTSYNSIIITPINLTVSLFPMIEDGLQFWGMLYPENSDFNYILIEDDGKICGMSQEIMTKLKIFSKNEELTIQQICPEFKSINEALNIYIKKKREFDELNLGAYHASQEDNTDYQKDNIITTFFHNLKEYEDISKEMFRDGRNLNFISIRRKTYFIQENQSPLISKQHSLGKGNYLQQKYHCKVKLNTFQNKGIKVLVLDKPVKEKGGIRGSPSPQLRQRSRIENRKPSDRRNMQPKVDVVISSVDMTNNKFSESDPSFLMQNSRIKKSFGDVDSFQDVNESAINVDSPMDLLKSNHFPFLDKNGFNETEDINHSINTSAKQTDNEIEFSETEKSTLMLDMVSMKSEFEHENKGFDAALFEIVSKLKLNSTKEIYFVVISLVLFLIMNVMGIFLAHNFSNTVIPKIVNSIDIINDSLRRVFAISRLTTEIYYQYVHEFHYSFYLTPTQLENYIAEDLMYVKEAAFNLVQINTNLESKVKQLEPYYQEKFYSKDIKIYTDDFQNLLTTTEYMKADSFKSVNTLLSYVLVLFQYFGQRNDYFRYSQNFILANSMNDLIIQGQELPNLLINDAKDKSDYAIDKANILININMALLSFAVLVSLIMFYRIYKLEKNFLKNLINHEKPIEIEKILNNIIFFKKLMETDMQGRTLIKSYADANSKKEVKKDKKKKYSIYKSGDNKLLFMIILQKLMLSIGVLIVPVVLFLISLSNFITNTNSLIPILKDLVRIRQIPLQGAIAFNQIAFFAVKNDTIFKLQPLEDIIEEDISNLNSFVSTSQGQFLESSKEILYGDLCTLITPISASLGRSCPRYFSGAMKKGLAAVIETMQVSYKSYLRWIPIVNQNVSKYTLRERFPSFISDSFYSLHTQVDILLTNFSNITIAAMIENLNQTESQTLNYAIYNIIISVVFVISLYFLVHIPIRATRKILIKTLLLFPAEFLASHKGVKMMMVKEAKAFSFFKHVEKHSAAKNPYMLPIHFLSLKRSKEFDDSFDEN